MKRRFTWLFFLAASLFLVAALVPVFKGGPVNAIFLSSSALWMIMGVIARRNARRGDSDQGS
jgi:hypothetical protein